MGSPDELTAAKRRTKNAGMAWLRKALAASEAVMAPAVDEGTLSSATSSADGEATRNEPPRDGAASIKLPPVTHLVRLAEQARKYATWHADLRCVQHEKEILPRLYKIANRLTGYYEQHL